MWKSPLSADSIRCLPIPHTHDVVPKKPFFIFNLRQQRLQSIFGE